MDVPREAIYEIVTRALREDLGERGDATTLALIPADAGAEARVVLREDGVIAGMPVLTTVFEVVDPRLVVTPVIGEGAAASAGTTIARITGPTRGILTGERVALNFIQRMSGIATTTAQYAAAISELPAHILDTRKTTPGLRVLEKYAVRIGGGVNHRFGLYDAVLIKDNHLAAHGVDVGGAVRRARAAVGPLVKIEVEVETVEQARLAAAAGADIILLDNMPPEMLRAAVAAIGGRALTEASGGINLATIRSIAETGVDYISVGALTHSARALDISLDLVVGGDGS